MAIQTNGKSVDVQNMLMQSRRRNRPPGVIPYPVEYTDDQATHDNWNHLFCKKLFGNPSMHAFSVPPSNVLDLGCGTGLWILEAATQWLTSSFVGLDMLRSQPDPQYTSSAIPEASRRIRWVHGNLLDPLPFAPETFDFVRISGIGLGVPEDEWQDLFQEVARVMTPNAVLEVMEEDLIFPSGHTPKPPKDVRLVIPRETTSELSLSTSPPKPSPSPTSPSALTSKSVTSLATKSPRRSPKPLKEVKESSNSTLGSGSYTSSIPVSTELEELDFEELLDPRDHSKLKTAWDKMLDKRFLTSGVLAVLPFYLSAEFADVQIKTALNVPLPPNSVYVPTEDDTRSPFIPPTRARSNTLRSIASVLDETTVNEPPDPAELLAADCASNYRERSRSVTTSSWASMHLAKTVSHLQGCKEAVWEEYSKLGCSFVSDPPINIIRAEFQTAWSDWERDMKNRMGMRANLPRFASWTAQFPGDDPDWKAWRARKAVWDLRNPDVTSENAPVELCRCLRGFIARKPSTAPKG